MDKQFWINKWENGQTRFHQGIYNAQLLKYFPQLKTEEGQRILVPLCGKAKDLIWLSEQGLIVRGIEFYERPVREFFEENKGTRNIEISCMDFMNLDEPAGYDCVYDRAALVALPPGMRPAYANVVTKSLKAGGKYLLFSLEHDELTGPPFSVTEREIKELYGNWFSIERLEKDSYLLTKLQATL